MKKLARKIRYSYRSLPDKKQYVEFFTALLTVPVLLTVIILNLNNLKSSQKNATPTPVPINDRPIVVTVAKDDDVMSPTPQNTVCKKGIGPIGISYPEEGDTVSENPIQISINYQQEDFCSVVWAYRINNGRFSDYDDRSIALFNPPKGTITFQLKVKSIVTSEEKVLTRTFVYNGSNDQPNSASSSAN